MKFWDYLIKSKRKLHRKYNLFYKKFSAMNYCKNNIKTLIIGSSHGLYGYKAQNEDFNFCETSQGLYESYKIYEYYVNSQNLKNVILFYSVFSNGFELSKTKENQLCAAYKYFFNINYKEEKDIQNTIEKLSKIFNKNNKLKNFNGNISKYKTLYTNPQERTKTHLRENKRNNLQNKWLNEIIKLSTKNNHNLYLCIPPARNDYRNLMPKKEELFNSLYEIINNNKNINFMNFYDNENYDDSDFCDTDHLNLKGAKKLTAMIKKFMV